MKTSCNYQKILFIALVALPMLLIGPANAAAAVQWESLGPNGGDRFGLEISPLDNQTLFVYGHRAIHKSVDAGLTWNPIATPEMIYNNSILALAIDPQAPQEMFVGGTVQGIWHSGDEGATWSLSSDGIPMVGEDAYASISSLAFDSLGDIYAGITMPDGQAETSPAHIYRSSDNGLTWVEAQDGISISEQPLTQTISTLFSTDAAGGLWASVYGGGVYRLEQDLWVSHNGDLPEGALKATYLTHNPSVAGHMLLGTEDGWIYESLDFGAAWTSVQLPEALLETVVYPLIYFVEFDPGNPDHIVVRAKDSTGSIETPLFKARPDQVEGGSTYECLDSDRSWHTLPGFLFRLTFDAAETIEGEIHRMGSVLRSKVIYATSAGSFSVLKSEDGGLTYAPIVEGIDNIFINALLVLPNESIPSETRIYGAAENGIYTSRDLEYQWKRQRPVTNHLYTWSLAENFADPGQMFYGTGNPAWSYGSQRGVYVTDADCLSDPAPECSPGEQLLADVGVWTVVTTPADPLKIYAACQEDGIMVSPDGGLTWETLNDGFILPISVTDIVLDSDGTPLFASVRETNGEFGSNLGRDETGAIYAFDPWLLSWERVDEAGYAVFAMDYDFNTGILLAATAQGISRTEDGGATWQQLDDTKSYRDIMFDQSVPGLAYAACGTGVCRSFDGGLTWHFTSDGMQPVGVNQLEIDDTTGVVFAATSGTSIYRLAPDPDPRPILELGAEFLDFGSVFVGDTGQINFSITNSGEAALTINAISCPRADITIDEGFPRTILPYASGQVTVSFSPLAQGAIDTSITINSDDPVGPATELPAIGTGSDKVEPTPDIKANGEDGPLTLTAGTRVAPTVSLASGDYFGTQAEFWVRADTRFGLCWFVAGQGWVFSETPIAARVGPIFDFESISLGSGAFPTGDYVLEFGIDKTIDGEFNPGQIDSVSFSIY